MADDTTQEQDRVAKVVARVEDDVPRRAQWVVQHTVRALDDAGLLLTAARRERIVAFLSDAINAYHRPAQIIERDALLRELAGDGGAPASEPTPAPRRMAANLAVLWPAERPWGHGVEHNETLSCAMDPPCRPVAPHDSDPWEATRDAAYREAAPSCAEHDDPIREGRIVDYIDEQGVEWTRSERVRRTMPPAPTHEHRWAPIAWQDSPSLVGMDRFVRVTREHCTRGDCTATREVGHGVE